MPFDLLREHIDGRVARYELRACAAVGLSPRVSGRVWVHGDGEVIVGDRVVFDGSTAPIELYPWAGASIVIGDDSYLAGGTSIESTSSIKIGARARIEGFCSVMDNHFHPLVGDRHARPSPRPVVIEDDVVLGPRTIVLAGARVERGARVPAGTVIKRPRSAATSARVVDEEIITRGEARLSGRYFAGEMLRLAGLLATDRKKAYVRIARGVGLLRAAVLFRECERGKFVNALGPVRVVAEGRIRLGDRVQLAGGMISTELVCRAGGELLVGAYSLLSYGVSIEATRSIRIGERCMLGSMVRIRDAGEGGGAPVVIGDDVWLAHGAIIEPGVTIGEGSVVSAGSVVRGDLPAYSLAVGNPAVSVPLSGIPVRQHSAGSA
jgi:acetyltransferase-like isoleucine patch superfamily enzyme